jgi:hypothetical protein
MGRCGWRGRIRRRGERGVGGRVGRLKAAGGSFTQPYAAAGGGWGFDAVHELVES